jgi:hypothetical protein
MNYIKSAIQYITRSNDIRPLHRQELRVSRSAYVLRIAAVMDPATRIAGIGWIILHDDLEITRGTTSINSHNDRNIALYRAFHHGLECARLYDIHNLTVETANPDFMLSSDREANPFAKKIFKQLRKQLFHYIPKNFARIHYTTLINDPEDVVAYILREMAEEVKDER